MKVTIMHYRSKTFKYEHLQNTPDTLLLFNTVTRSCIGFPGAFSQLRGISEMTNNYLIDVHV